MRDWGSQRGCSSRTKQARYPYSSAELREGRWRPPEGPLPRLGVEGQQQVADAHICQWRQPPPLHHHCMARVAWLGRSGQASSVLESLYKNPAALQVSAGIAARVAAATGQEHAAQRHHTAPSPPSPPHLALWVGSNRPCTQMAPPETSLYCCCWRCWHWLAGSRAPAAQTRRRSSWSASKRHRCRSARWRRCSGHAAHTAAAAAASGVSGQPWWLRAGSARARWPWRKSWAAGSSLLRERRPCPRARTCCPHCYCWLAAGAL